MLMSANERTGWRDDALSLRHREWGHDCPAVDLDFLLIEYDRAEPKALVEYKNEHAQPIVVSKSPSIRAMAKLADDANLPAFLVRYADDFTWWKVRPLNRQSLVYAMPYLSDQQYDFIVDELEYVALLYKLRGRQMPQSVADHISDMRATQEASVYGM